MLTEDVAFALFFVPTPGNLTAQKSTPREFAIQGKKKMAVPGGQPERRGGGLGAGGIDWYIKSVYVTVYNGKSGESRKSEDSTAFRMFIQCPRGYFL